MVIKGVDPILIIEDVGRIELPVSKKQPNVLGQLRERKNLSE